MDEDGRASRSTSTLRDTVGCLVWWSLLVAPPLFLLAVWSYRETLGRYEIIGAFVPIAAALVWRFWEGWFGRATR